jgi:hypothetical protein
MMEMITVKKSELEDTIRDIVGQSHQSLAAVQSNSIADMKTTLAVIIEKQDYTNEHLKDLNGKSVTNSMNIHKLQLSNSWIRGIGITVVTLGALTLGAFTYAYNSNNELLKAGTEAVAKNLDAHETQNATDNQQIIQLLKMVSLKK